ncbi:MAG TPA: hypothetical protein PKY82_30610 [Pyrinomonadaceae bacterium]|nr:hypothetical protein [Pyrinomonadaceae bacterium]
MKYTLENFEVPKPCSMNWDEMKGNEEIRHCDRCQHQIYNLSEMPTRRALKVLNQPDEKVCVTYLQDDNNKVITQTYFGIFKRNFVKVFSAILAVIFSLTSIQAMQTKNGKPKKKKVVKHRKHKKITKPPKIIIGKRVPTKPPILGMPQFK